MKPARRGAVTHPASVGALLDRLEELASLAAQAAMPDVAVRSRRTARLIDRLLADARNDPRHAPDDRSPPDS